MQPELLNDPEVQAFVSAIQGAPQISAVIAEAQDSPVNEGGNFDAKAIPEYKPHDPAGPAPAPEL